MRLFIQIPCLNEAKSLPEVIADLPKEIEGVEEIGIVIIDDGSTDETSEVARQLGVNHIVRFPKSRGLASGFMAGLDACLQLGADIIVNTDGDGQYKGSEVANLIQPILKGRADIVVGDRCVRTISEFSSTKKLLQVLGSWVVRRFSGTEVPDTTSGFRALTREAAMRMFVASEFTYTLETLILAGNRRLNVTSVPITVNPKTRKSRLFGSIWEYVRRSAVTILRAYAIYRPLPVFLSLALLCILSGIGLGGRFLCFYLSEEGPTGHVQSLILSAVLLISGLLLTLLGILADLMAMNHKMLEDVRFRLTRLETSFNKTESSRSVEQPDHQARQEEQQGLAAQ